MRKFNKGKPFHGSADIEGGKLTGSTDTDYFYFICPKCADSEILQILDYKIVANGPIEYAPDHRTRAKKDFTLAFELYCGKCRLHDFVKVSNTGWQGGSLNSTIPIDRPPAIAIDGRAMCRASERINDPQS